MRYSKVLKAIHLMCCVWRAGGKWDDAWIVDGVPRTTGVTSGRLDMYYISPDGKRMRSMSEVYSFLGLTAAPTKSSAPPAPTVTAAHVAAAAATAATSGRGVREAKLSASAAITGAHPIRSYHILPCPASHCSHSSCEHFQHHVHTLPGSQLHDTAPEWRDMTCAQRMQLQQPTRTQSTATPGR